MERYEPHVANIKDDYTLIKSAAENDKKQKTMAKWIDSKSPMLLFELTTHIRAVNFHINGLPILTIDEMTDKERIESSL